MLDSCGPRIGRKQQGWNNNSLLFRVAFNFLHDIKRARPANPASHLIYSSINDWIEAVEIKVLGNIDRGSTVYHYVLGLGQSINVVCSLRRVQYRGTGTVLRRCGTDLVGVPPVRLTLFCGADARVLQNSDPRKNARRETNRRWPSSSSSSSVDYRLSTRRCLRLMLIVFLALLSKVALLELRS